MEKYRFKIEGQDIENPEGWKDFELQLKRDNDIAGLLVTSTNEFFFKGVGYDFLKDRFDDNYNDKVNVSIEILQEDDSYILQYQGVVILTDVKFNLEKRTAAATIEDRNFQGAIQNNKNIKSFLNAGITKNGEQVSVPATFFLDYFQSNGNYNPVGNRGHVRVKAALDFLVRFMTDDLVKGITSAYLDDTSNWEGFLPYITTGEEIRLGGVEAPNISFSELITFLSRTHDLTFDFIEDINGDPIMRIEEREFFFNAVNSDIIRDIVDLTVEIDANRIASHLEVGNNNFIKAGNCSTTTRFFAFKKEDYSLRGKGNIDKLIDLTTDFITDSNTIENIVNVNGDEFDDEVFIVLGDSSLNQVAKFQTPLFCSDTPFYNLGFTNDNIIDRQLQSIPNSITKYLTAATTPAKAEQVSAFEADFGGTPAQTTITIQRDFIIPLVSEIYDLGNNYSDSLPVTFYDVPFAGDFSFEASVQQVFILTTLHNVSVFTNAALDFQIAIERFDSNFTTPPKEQVLSSVIAFNFGGDPAFEGQLSFQVRSLQTTMTCATGDRIVIRIIQRLRPSRNIARLSFRVLSSPLTFFKCLGADDDAGTFKVFDPNTFRARLFRFRKNLSLTRTDNIRANSRNSIIINEFSDPNLDKAAFIEEMTNNIETGETNFTLIN